MGLIFFCLVVLSPIPPNKILDLSKLRAYADGKFNLAKIVRVVIDWVGNIVGKGENDSYQLVLSFFWPQYFH